MIIKKIYNSLNFIKNNSVEGLDQSFTWVIKDENDESKEIELINDGLNVLIDDNNKEDFIDKV